MATVFTVTQITYNFTATVNTTTNLTLVDTPYTVTVVNSATSVSVINNVQPVTISLSGGGGGSSYNQSLNTTDNVAFATLTVPTIYGPAQQPVYFPNGISTVNYGTYFTAVLDVGGIYNTFTNQFSLITALLPLNFGTLVNPAPISLIF
jgi:hypothetical protein